MSLLDRVTTLIRANLNDLIDKSEDPEKLLKQLLLDMQNQFMQLKTQAAIAIADHHLLEAKRVENETAQAAWMQKAELALAHNEEPLARIALDHALTHQTAADHFARQVQDQARHVASLRESLTSLETKMAETQTQTDILIARHHRARNAVQTNRPAFPGANREESFERMRAKVSESEALRQGFAAMNEPGAQQKLETLEKNDRIDLLLAELKRNQAAK